MPADTVINGRFRVGRMTLPRETWAVLDNPTCLELFGRIPDGQVETDLAIEADMGAECVFVDCDTHHWAEKPSHAALLKWLDDIRPCPFVSWITHGNGLRAIYTTSSALSMAVSATIAVPTAFKVEIKRISRHPLSVRNGQRCGTVIYASSPPPTTWKFAISGSTLTPEARSSVLASMGLTTGERYPHDRCPIAPDSPQDGNDCVVVYGDAVHCFQCEAAGKSFRPNLPPGMYPLAIAAGTEQTDLARLAANWVHWTHAKIELQHYYPNLSDRILRAAYRLALEATTPHGANDPRIPSVFNEALDFFWTGVWTGSKSFNTREVDCDAAAASPYCQFVEEEVNEKTKETKLVVKVDKARKSQFRVSVPQGYKPIRLFRSVDFRARSTDSVPLEILPGPRHAVRLLAAPTPELQAFETIEKAFPRINRAYLKGVLAAGMVAARGGGRKPQLCADGPSGAGKNETVRLAASFMGDDALTVRLTGNEEEIARYFGKGLIEGHRFFIIDELNKTPGLLKKVGTLLQFSSVLNWRPLYGAPTVTDFDAAIFYPSVTFPDFLKKSTEFCRRTRRIRLVLRVPEWGATCGGETTKWRDLTESNAHAANSLLTHVYNLCAAHDYKWERIADEIGLGRLDDDADTPTPERYLELYRYCHGDLGAVQFLDTALFPGRGWVDAGHGPAKKLIDSLIDYDCDDPKKARNVVKNNLEALPWNNFVGFDTPSIRIRVRCAHGKMGIRFEECGCLRGRERINGELPGVPGVAKPVFTSPTMEECGMEKLKVW